MFINIISCWLLLFELDIYLLFQLLCICICIFIIYIMFVFNIFLIVLYKYYYIIISVWNNNYIIDILWYLFCSILLSMLLFKLINIIYLLNDVFIIFDIIKIISYQWFWIFNYNISLWFINITLETDLWIGDLRLINTIYTITFLIGINYKLLITSADVIHTLCIINLGIKIDVIPKRCNELLLYYYIIGSIYKQCNELCNILHGFMPIHILIY